jgi:hypothetical protein
MPRISGSSVIAVAEPSAERAMTRWTPTEYPYGMNARIGSNGSKSRADSRS